MAHKTTNKTKKEPTMDLVTVTYLGPHAAIWLEENPTGDAYTEPLIHQVVRGGNVDVSPGLAAQLIERGDFAPTE